MLQADAADHSRLRRIFAPAFSTRALTQQEDLIAKYADLLITRLTREADHPHDMSLWYNCTTFDIMGDLALGQPLGLLDKGGDTGGALLVFSSLRVLPILQVIQYYPVLEKLYALFEPRKLRKMREGHFNHIGDMVDLRLEKGSSHPDILNLALKAADQDEESNKFTREDAHSNAVLFMAAGTETTGAFIMDRQPWQAVFTFAADLYSTVEVVLTWKLAISSFFTDISYLSDNNPSRKNG